MASEKRKTVDYERHVSEERNYLLHNGWRQAEINDNWYHPDYSGGIHYARHAAVNLTANRALKNWADMTTESKGDDVSQPNPQAALRDIRAYAEEMHKLEDQVSRDGVTLRALRAEGAVRAFSDMMNMLDASDNSGPVTSGGDLDTSAYDQLSHAFEIPPGEGYSYRHNLGFGYHDYFALVASAPHRAAPSPDDRGGSLDWREHTGSVEFVNRGPDTLRVFVTLWYSARRMAR